MQTTTQQPWQIRFERQAELRAQAEERFRRRRTWAVFATLPLVVTAAVLNSIAARIRR